MVAMCQENGCNMIPTSRCQAHIWCRLTTGLPENSHALNNSMLSFARRAHQFVSFQGYIKDAGVFALESCVKFLHVSSDFLLPMLKMACTFLSILDY